MSGDFDPEQKRYLEGFMLGMQIAKTARPAAAKRRCCRSGADRS
jgi:hypothetical protein